MSILPIGSRRRRAEGGQCRRPPARRLGRLALAAGLAAAAAAADAARAADPVGTPFPVSRFLVSFAPMSAEQATKTVLPSLNELGTITVDLETKGGVYVAKGSGGTPVQVRLDQTFPTAAPFSYGAIAAVEKAIVDRVHSLDIWSVFVDTPDDILEDPQSPARYVDHRPANKTTLGLTVVIGVVTHVHTINLGVTDEAKREDSAEYQGIRAGSPVQAETYHNFVSQSAVDDYLAVLNRRGVRHVYAAISSDSPDYANELRLDYLVRENKHFSAYAGLSNTGTEDTGILRGRFGVIGNSVLGFDDTLSADVTTSFTDKSNAINLDYNAPFAGNQRLRYDVHADYSNFRGSEIGATEVGLKGDNSEVSLELIDTLVSHANSPSDKVFLDAFGGARGAYLSLNNTNELGSGFADLPGGQVDVSPYAGLRFEHAVPECPTFAEVRATGVFIVGAGGGANLDSLKSQNSAAENAQSSALGRVDISRMALVLNGSLTQSIFLDPLVAPHRFEHGNGLLAYEIFGSVNGQYTPNSRLSPIRESVVGGLYSVRGYKQSIESGDSSVVGTVEFRLHIPRLFALDTADPDVQKPFSFTPRRPHVNPDWDLIVRPFIDAGYVYNNGSARTSSTDANGNTVANTYAGTYQEDHSHLLVGAGVGAELDVKQNLSVRVDYGIALKSVNAIQTVGANVVTRNDASAGSSVVSFSVLAAY